MRLLLDAFWRAAAYCLHPQVIALSLLPLVIGSAIAVGTAWLFWEEAVTAVRLGLESWALLDAAMKWLEAMLGASFRAVLAPVIVVALAVPVIVVMSVLLVALLMTPALVRLVAQRRFADLERKRGAGLVASVAWSLGCTLLGLLMLAASLPFWLIPPLMLVLPPLIWGWLTTRVMAFDSLAEHASAEERRALMREHRWPLLAIGVTAGYLGAAPTLLWAVSAATLVLAPFLVAVSVWLYTLIFAFSALWFAHYTLAALAALRAERIAAAAPMPMVEEVIDLPPAASSNTLPPAAP